MCDVVGDKKQKSMEYEKAQVITKISYMELHEMRKSKKII